ncbi:DUF4220 domain-containing protein [Citrus sinensis]|uniref:DUF4220 domain-containing protein n=1 Tax=Citrus sinensis TaxID=2711 RepID=A0ACB8JLG0_CITSI|nr:DUF4220 domain-containing protein [Citrus sinensis]
MLHLGGPDTITAFALEDNELWLRHLFGLIFQAVAAVYIFLTSLPGNKLFFPTALVFIAGMIKYFERIRALYLASMEKFRDSALRGEVEHLKRIRSLQKKNGKMLCSKKTKGGYLEVGCRYFKLFKLILVDLIPSFECLIALGIIEVELNLVYEVLHTKIQVTHSVLAIILRFICFCSVVAALSVFHFQVEKHGFNEFDVCVTYTLFLGAIALDIIAFFKLVFSDWTFNRIAAILCWFLILKTPRWHLHGGGKYEVLATPFFWMRYWLKGRPSRVPKVKSGLHLACQKVIHYLGIDRLIPCMAIATNKVIQFLHIYKIIALFDRSDIVYEIRIKTSLSHKPLTKELWQFLFDEIKAKVQSLEAANKRKCSASGDCTLQDINVSVAIWHVTTELLYYTAEEVSNEMTNNAREFSKILSDYMLYLLQFKPTMLNSAPYNRDAANEFFRKKSLKPSAEKFACEKIMLEPDLIFSDPHDRKEFSALEDATALACERQMLDEDKKWERVSKVWMEILSYGAIHCSPMTHAQQVTSGGELITFVWLLMHHFNLVEPQA